MSASRRLGIIVSAMAILVIAVLAIYFGNKWGGGGSGGKPDITVVTGGYETMFSGAVVSAAGKPVQSAAVEVNGAATTSDKNGKFSLVVPATASYRFNVDADNFAPLRRILQGGFIGRTWRLTPATSAQFDPSRTITLSSNVGSSNCSGTYSARTDWSAYPRMENPVQKDASGTWNEAPWNPQLREAVEFHRQGTDCNPGVSISIPGNSLVDANGNAPGGNVKVTLATVDLFSPFMMPGDDTVQGRDGIEVMRSFGAGSIDVTGGGGRLNLRKGTTATLSIPINPSQLKVAKPPASIPLLVYDRNAGLWRHDGVAKLDREGRAYVAEIGHLSEFNMDLVKIDQSCIRLHTGAIVGDFELEITIPYGTGAPVVRTVYVNNTTSLHAIYNLPNDTNILLRPFYIIIGLDPIPIGTFFANTGPPQDPTDPNRPDPPYAACKGDAVFADLRNTPSLTAPASSSGNFDLSWSYTWVGPFASTADGYQLEESNTSGTSGFSTILDTVNTNDHASPKVVSLFRGAGSYWYRVRAFDEGGFTPYSNVAQVSVASAPGTATLRIINDLEHNVVGPNDWFKLNQIIRVRIGPDTPSVQSNPGYERMYPYDSTFDNLASTFIVYPERDTSTYYWDFDVSANGPNYSVYIQNGWWDYFPLYGTWEKHMSVVVACNGVDLAYKWVSLDITGHSSGLFAIRASDFLPHGSWPGHPTCP